MGLLEKVMGSNNKGIFSNKFRNIKKNTNIELTDHLNKLKDHLKTLKGHLIKRGILKKVKGSFQK